MPSAGCRTASDARSTAVAVTRPSARSVPNGPHASTTRRSWSLSTASASAARYGVAAPAPRASLMYANSEANDGSTAGAAASRRISRSSSLEAALAQRSARKRRAGVRGLLLEAAEHVEVRVGERRARSVRPARRCERVGLGEHDPGVLLGDREVGDLRARERGRALGAAVDRRAHAAQQRAEPDSQLAGCELAARHHVPTSSRPPGSQATAKSSTRPPRRRSSQRCPRGIEIRRAPSSRLTRASRSPRRSSASSDVASVPGQRLSARSPSAVPAAAPSCTFERRGVEAGESGSLVQRSREAGEGPVATDRGASECRQRRVELGLVCDPRGRQQALGLTADDPLVAGMDEQLVLGGATFGIGAAERRGERHHERALVRGDGGERVG